MRTVTILSVEVAGPHVSRASMTVSSARPLLATCMSSRKLANTLMAVVVNGLLLATTQAVEVFDFIVTDDGVAEVFATLKLKELPAFSVDDVVELSFSPAGQEYFGFPPVYGGSFDQTNPFEGDPRIVVSVIDGGLAGINGDGVDEVTYQDVIDLPDSSMADSDSILVFSFTASEPHQDDALTLRYLNVAGESQTLRRFGSFLAVPEPTAVTLLGLALCSLGAFRVGQIHDK